MLPPIDPLILESNPNFARLHARLTTSILAADASTNSTNLSHFPTAQALHKYQVEATKDGILKLNLNNLLGLKDSSDEFVLPAPLRDLIYSISLYISEGPTMDLSTDDHDLMAPEVNDFLAHLPEIAAALSNCLQSQHGTLHTIASQGLLPQQQRTTKHPPPTLQSILTNLQTASTTAPLESTFSTLLTLLSLQTTHLKAQITHLERHTHGTLSRHSSARAVHLSTVAAALALKTRVTYLSTLKSTYTGDMQCALDNYSRHLKGEERRLREREGVLRGIVDEYDGVRMDGNDNDEGGHMGLGGNRAFGNVMQQLGLKYGEILNEIEDVKNDIRTLEAESSTTRKGQMKR